MKTSISTARPLRGDRRIGRTLEVESCDVCPQVQVAGELTLLSNNLTLALFKFEIIDKLSITLSHGRRGNDFTKSFSFLRYVPTFTDLPQARPHSSLT
jgi:hypothetical protein